VQQDLSVPVHDTEGHGAGMQINATVKLVLFRVKSPEVSSSSWWLSPTTSIPPWYAEEGASISLTALEPTAPMGALWHASAVYGAAAHRQRSATKSAGTW
jgi:hypothetical protein